MRSRPPRRARSQRPPQAVRSPPPANRPGGLETGFSAGIAALQALERSLAEKLLQRPSDRRADGPQFVVALTQPLVGRQARHERAPAPFIELVVDQSDKFGVFVSHRLTRRTLLLQFRQRRARRGQPAHDRADRDCESRRRFGVSVPVAVDQQHRFALSLGKLPNGS